MTTNNSAAAALSTPSESGVTPAPGESAVPPSASTAPSTSTNSWTDGFSDENKTYVQHKKWASPSELLDSYRNIERFQSGATDVVKIPGPTAKAEEWEGLYNKLGRPDAASGYEFKGDDGKAFAEIAHKHNLTKSQAQGILEDMLALEESQENQLKIDNENRFAQEMNEVKQEWGKDYDKKVVQGTRAAAALGFDQDAMNTLESKLGTKSAMNLFADIGAMMKEGEFIEGSSAKGFGNSSHEAKLLIQQKQTDPAFMKQYLDGNKEYVQEMARLMRVAYDT